MSFDLSDEQISAAAATTKRTFVEAGPGTGKTTVLAERFGVLAFTQTAPNGSVLALSFTRSATQELRDRILARWGPSALSGDSGVSTIDGELTRLMCYLLRSGVIEWPGGVQAVEPQDSWDGVPGYEFRPTR